MVAAGYKYCTWYLVHLVPGASSKFLPWALSGAYARNSVATIQMKVHICSTTAGLAGFGDSSRPVGHIFLPLPYVKISFSFARKVSLHVRKSFFPSHILCDKDFLTFSLCEKKLLT